MMRSSTSPLAVSMMMGTDEPLSRMILQTRSPESLGSMRSRITRFELVLLKLVDGGLAVAPRPQPKYPLAVEIYAATASRMAFSSSTKRIRFASEAMVGLLSFRRTLPGHIVTYRTRSIDKEPTAGAERARASASASMLLPVHYAQRYANVSLRQQYAYCYKLKTRAVTWSGDALLVADGRVA